MVPDINDAYEEYGSNAEGLIVLAAHASGSDAQVISWDNTNNVKYPSFSGQNGGSSLFSTYKVGATPTLILIAPDQKIVEKDIWPISNLPSTLDKYDIGVTEISKNSNLLKIPQISLKVVSSQNLILTVPCDGIYTINTFSADGQILGTISTGLLAQGEHTIQWNSAQISRGIYFIQVGSGNLKVTEKIVLP